MTHERALIDDLMRKIESVARSEGAERVTAIGVRLGPLSHFTPEHFREHFEWASRGSVAEGADVRIEQWEDVEGADAQGVVLSEVEVAAPS